MKKFLIFTFFIFLFYSSNAQDKTSGAVDTTYWKRGGLASLNINQVSFTNWAAGGQNAFSGTVLINCFVNYKKEKTSWDNSIDLGYGLVKLGDGPMQKNEDRIIINSKYGRQISSKWYYSGLVNLRSQFAPGYNYPNDSIQVSRFLAPAFAIVSLGFDYRPKDYFSLYVSPATGKFTIVNDQQLANTGAYGVTAAEYDASGNILSQGKKTRGEFGAYLSAKFEKNIMKNVSLKSRLDLFNGYTDKNKSNRGNIDVNWETNLNMKVNEFLSATIFTHLIYDHDILVPVYEKVDGIKTITGTGRRIQFKEVVGLSFSYKF